MQLELLGGGGENEAVFACGIPAERAVRDRDGTSAKAEGRSGLDDDVLDAARAAIEDEIGDDCDLLAVVVDDLAVAEPMRGAEVNGGARGTHRRAGRGCGFRLPEGDTDRSRRSDEGKDGQHSPSRDVLHVELLL